MSRFAAIHNIKGCQEIAFFMKEPPKFGEPFRVDAVVMPDGKHPVRKQNGMCPECGNPLRESELIFQFEDAELPVTPTVIFVPALNL